MNVASSMTNPTVRKLRNHVTVSLLQRDPKEGMVQIKKHKDSYREKT